MKGTSGQQRDFWPAMGFLMPNLLGFLVFTVGPVAFSLGMALTNWDIQQTVPLRCVGGQNFAELAADDQFWLCFLNTVYLMLGMPLAIAGSLFLALLLSQRLNGIVVYRTMFYLPAFTSGVALMILWKALLNRDFGPINAAINAVLRAVGLGNVEAPAWLSSTANVMGLAAVLGGLLLLTILYIALRRAAGERARRALAVSLVAVGAAILAFLARGGPVPAVGAAAVLAAAFLGLGLLVRRWARPLTAFYLLTLAAAVVLMLRRPGSFAVGLAVEEAGLTPDEWGLGARDALIMMGIWTAIGGNNMLLYIAALSNVPQELYEAAQVDGAGRWAAFWNVTWPQLAPTTFFIVVMSFIGGLQGGFDQARVMTGGGPAGTTTTLVYYIYTKAFLEFQMGYASAISWVLFTLIFAVTLVNWKFGAKELSY